MSRFLRAVLLVCLLFALCTAGASADPLDEKPSSSLPEPGQGQSFASLSQSIGPAPEWQGRVNAPLALAYRLWQARTAPVAAGVSPDQVARQEALDSVAGALQAQADVVFDGPTAGSNVLINTTDNAAALEAMGIRVQARIGDVATAFVPFDRLEEVAGLPSVIRIEGSTIY
ncbi:MAG: hypothetical protein ACM30E_03200, partial [Nitrososphaerales archaeon]